MGQVTVMGEGPVSSPKFSGERVNVFEDGRADCCVADVGYYVVGFYWLGLEEGGEGRSAGGVVIVECFGGGRG